MKKSVLALACTTVVALALTACTGPVSTKQTPTRTPSPAATTSSPTSSATPTPEPAAVASSVVISVDVLTIVDESGQTFAEFDYFGADATAAVAALTEAFGVAPAVREAKSTNHPESNAVVSEWPGFELRDLTPETSYPDAVDFWVKATAADINGIAVRTSSGVHVQMAFADVEPLSFSHSVGKSTSQSAEVASFALEQQLVEPPREGEGGPARFSVGAWGETSVGFITEISAPGANFGP